MYQLLGVLSGVLPGGIIAGKRFAASGWTENAGVDIDGVTKKRGWTLQD